VSIEIDLGLKVLIFRTNYSISLFFCEVTGEIGKDWGG
jgi:hypothetical protein